MLGKSVLEAVGFFGCRTLIILDAFGKVGSEKSECTAFIALTGTNIKRNFKTGFYFTLLKDCTPLN